jgi:hypothetical protein
MSDPIVISETVQEFQGQRFYRCGPYFQRKGRRLHRLVWESANGPIPKGYEIHHMDHDKANNSLGNLELLPAKVHESIHGKMQADRLRQIRHLGDHAARAWHASEEGREWHKQNFEKNCRDVLSERVDLECKHCGIAFKGKHNSAFCSNNCKSASRRASGVDLVQRVCEFCGVQFSVNKYFKNRTCGRSCGKLLSSREKRALRADGCLLPGSTDNQLLCD